MADRYATKDGDWSDVSVWDGGASKPGAGDTVRPNAFVVDIDEDVEVTLLTNSAGGAAAAGGHFTCSTSCTITAGLLAWETNTDLLYWTGAGTLNLIGDLNTTAARVGNTAFGIAGSGVVNVTGDLYSYGGTNGVECCVKSGSDAVTITGTLTGGSSAYAYALRCVPGSTGDVTIVGDVIGSSAHALCAGIIFDNGSNCVLYHSGGTMLAGTSSAAFRMWSGVVVLSPTSISQASIGRPAFEGFTSTAIFVLAGIARSGPTGIFPFELETGALLLVDPANPVELELRENAALSPGDGRSLYTADNPLGTDTPAEADVRLGTVYDDAASTGALAVPDPSLVAEGVATDATVGTMKAARLQRATAVPAFPFVMKSTTGAPLPGLTVTAERSLDGAAFSACENAPAEVGNGVYTLDLATTDLDGDTVVLRFTASGAAEVASLIVTG